MLDRSTANIHPRRPGRDAAGRRRPVLTAFIVDEAAAAATEYALILAFMALVCIGALGAIGSTVSGPYNALAGEFLSVIGAG